MVAKDSRSPLTPLTPLTPHRFTFLLSGHYISRQKLFFLGGGLCCFCFSDRFPSTDFAIFSRKEKERTEVTCMSSPPSVSRREHRIIITPLVTVRERSPRVPRRTTKRLPNVRVKKRGTSVTPESSHHTTRGNLCSTITVRPE